MPDNGTEIPPDPRVAFTDLTTADTGQTDQRPGVSDRTAVAAKGGDPLPPLADEELDDRPLALRFTETASEE
ncbi:hypothetical protein [Streptosporangium longisporum]|uniref:Uncharacterized protein n=1 Tax=Streptosporangium longisporum TaxID=46187 RepID=A0ABN3Y8P3_9ACTN